MQVSSKRAVTFETVSRLNAIFTKQNWHELSKPAPVNSRFDAFCKLLELLDPSEQQLILTLTEDFLHCTWDQYRPLIIDACSQLVSTDLGTGEIIVIPFTTPSDVHKAKSGEFVAYSIKALANEIPAFRGKSLTSLAHVNSLAGRGYDGRSDATILFVDDYIGTGETAIEAIDEFESKYSKPDDRVAGVCLVALQTGFRKVQRRIPSIVAAKTRKRGISDSLTISNKAAAIQLMTEIERRLGVDSDFQFGYLGSEGLESMLRTPDNTFPVFWYSGYDDKNPWPAPFLRT